MCFNGGPELGDAQFIMDLDSLAGVEQHDVSWLLSNVRGMRQASGEVRAYIAAHRLAFFALVETHLDRDSVKPLLPPGYQTVARLDRTKHGGGLCIGAREHLLVDKLNLAKYNTVRSAEIIGVRSEDVDYLLGYTNKSSEAIKLLLAVQLYMLDNPGRKVVLLGDFNVHNMDWITSTSTDAAGREAEGTCEMFGLSQLVHFPTRGGNTLDLVMSSIPGSCIPIEPMGSSDHKSVGVTFQDGTPSPPSPVDRPVLDWSSAPWEHMSAALKRALYAYDPAMYGSVDAAEAALNNVLQRVVSKYVKVHRPQAKLPAPWWNQHCARTLRHKCKLFQLLEAGIVSYCQYTSAARTCRKVQRKAFSRFQKRLRAKLDSMSNSDKNFWSLVKEL